jgi:hypothetical protein
MHQRTRRVGTSVIEVIFIAVVSPVQQRGDLRLAQVAQLPWRCVASADRYSSRLPSGGRLVTMERRWALADSPDASGRTTPKAMTDVVWLGRNGRVVVQARREIAYCFNHSLLGCAGAVHKLSLRHQGRRQGCTGPTDPATGVALDPCELVPRLTKLWRSMRGAVPPEPRHQPITRHGLR